MGREVKRVPLDFDWPMDKIWPGYMGKLRSMVRNSLSRKDRDELGWDGIDVLVRKFCKAINHPMDEHEENPENDEIDVPSGPGWQMWETTSEGSPISPVFETKEELARWLADTGASSFGYQTSTYDQWLAMINSGWCCTAVKIPGVGLVSGVEATSVMGGDDK